MLLGWVAVASCLTLTPLLLMPSDVGMWLARWRPDWLLTTLIGVLLFFAPGYLLLLLLWPRSRLLDGVSRMALALSVSVALPPLLLLLTSTIGLPWNSSTTWIWLIFCLLASVVLQRLAEQKHNSTTPRSAIQPATNETLAGWALLGIALAALLMRLYVVRDLPTGLFGDSYHHTLIAQLLVNHQGLFRSWEPYAPLTTFTYHFGFHANVAFFHWLTGISVVQSVIVVGQILNAAAVLLAFALARMLGGSAWHGVWAAALTGFAMSIPGFYVNWGRYTQLTGQIVLVSVLASWIGLAQQLDTSTDRLLPTLRHNWRLIVLAGMVTATLILTHYLVTMLAALFIASYLVVWLVVRRSGWLIWRLAWASLLAAIIALLLTSPWLINIANGYLTRNASGFVNGQVETARIASYASLPLLTPIYANGWVLAGAMLGMLIAGWQRRWEPLIPVVWSIMLVVAVSPQVVGLPGAGIIDNVTGISALYLTLPLLCGYALASLATMLSQVRGIAKYQLPTWLSLCGVLGILLLGTPQQSTIIRNTTQLVSQADMAAMEWIRANTPPDARFLINSFPAYGGNLVVGNDAGWWIPLLAARQTHIPTITYGSERGATPSYGDSLNRFAAELRGLPLTNAQPVVIDLTTREARALLKAARIRYIYNGAVSSPAIAATDHFNRDALRSSRSFRRVYNAGNVEIFELIERAP
jgi:hypothetical protein